MAKQVAPPKVTGGGGFVFEDKVAAYFLAFPLSGQPPLTPALGPPFSERLSDASFGNSTE